MNFHNRREPTFHDGARDRTQSGGHDGGLGVGHDGTYPSGAPLPHVTGHATGFGRFVSTLQIVGTLLGVPLGLASGYSIYRANFSPETTCQALRTNIIGMLDKNVDATTRRMLVRRDIEAFEQNCGAVDPDAHAAFKTLLAVPVKTKVAAKERTKDTTKALAHDIANDVAKDVTKVISKDVALAKPRAVAKAEHKPEQKVAAKSEIKSETKLEAKSETRSETKSETKSEAKPVLKAALAADEHAAGLSDANWLAAVRQALVTSEAERAARIEPARVEPVHLTTTAAIQPGGPAPAPRVVLQPAWNVTAPAVVPPEARAPQGQPQAVGQPEPPVRIGGADHPVPPAPIPVIAPVAGGQQAGPAPGQQPISEADRSTLGSWIAQIPLVGRVMEPSAK